MIEIGILPIRPLLEEQVDLQAYIDSRRLAELQRISSPAAKAQSTACDLLLSYYCKTRFSSLPYPPRRSRDESRKPFLTDAPEISISLTHSKAYAAVAMCTSAQVGLDIQSIRPPRPGMAKRYLHPQEADVLYTLSGRELVKTFTDIWAIKESYVKVSGQNLYKSMSAFPVKVCANHPISTPDGFYYMRIAPPDPEYCMAVCWKSTISQEIRITHFQLQDLLSIR